MKAIAFLCTVSAIFGQGLTGLEVAPGVQLRLGATQTTVSMKYGKPFGAFRVADADDNARVGVPVGLWQVYHLTAANERMYVTILHFGTTASGSETPADAVLDSVMLIPNGNWTVLQILKDHPELAAICTPNCEVLRITDNAGKVSLLLRPKMPKPDDTVLYFDGDSAVSKWRSVPSLQSITSWVYVLKARDFDAHHSQFRQESTGWWSGQG